MTILESRIADFISHANCGDEIALSRNASVEQGVGLIFGYDSQGFYLQDSGQRASLGVTVTADDVLTNATDWARDTGAELA
jgi:predicted Zn-dependent protease